MSSLFLVLPLGGVRGVKKGESGVDYSL